MLFKYTSLLYCTYIVMTAVFLLGCEDSRSSTMIECRLNSDCDFNQRCLEDRCEEYAFMEDSEDRCEQEGCACTTDVDCFEGYYCDLEEWECVPKACYTSRECELGKLCISFQCMTDLEADRDRDGVPDAEDSCPLQANSGQEDHDLDQLGDVCDPDDDNDQVPDYIDNCDLAFNPIQGNADADAEQQSDEELTGNACDSDTTGISIEGQLDLSVLPGADPTDARIYIGDRVESILVNPDGTFSSDTISNEPGRIMLRASWLGLAEVESELVLPDRVKVFRIEEPLRLTPILESRVELRGIITLDNGADASGIFVRAYIGDDILINTTFTDAQGAYIISVPRVSPLTIRFNYDGYLENEMTLEYDDEGAVFKRDGDEYDSSLPISLSRSRTTLNIFVRTEPDWLPIGQGSATITVSNSSYTQSQLIDSGNIVFDSLTIGSYLVEVRRDGFTPITQFVELPQGIEIDLNMTLRMQSIRDTNISLQGVQLSAEQLRELGRLDGADLSGVILRDQELCGLQMRGCSLVGADLSGADLSGADLSGARLDNTTLEGVNLIGAKLSDVSFFGANLMNAHLQPGIPSCGDRWIKTDLTGVNFSSALLGGARLTAELPPPNSEQSTCDRAELVSPEFSGAYWTGVNLNHAHLIGLNLENITLSGVMMRRANLTEACLRNTNIILSDLSGVNLSNANLSQTRLIDTILVADERVSEDGEEQVTVANFSGANLHQATISGSNLTGANLREIIGHGLILRDVTISDTDFSNASLTHSHWTGLLLNNIQFYGSDLSNADMRYVQTLAGDFSEASLERVNFLGATLNEADFSGLNMRGVNLSSTSMYNVNLEGTDLSTSSIEGEEDQASRFIGANFTFARYNGETVWPERFEPEWINALGPRSNLPLVVFPEGFEAIGVNLDFCNLGGGVINRVNLSDASIRNTYFTFKGDFTMSTPITEMNGSIFDRVDFTNSQISVVRAVGSSFRGAIFHGLSEAFNAENTSFSIKGTFTDADFQEATFNRVKISGNLQRTNFDSTILLETQFLGVQLTNVSMNNALLDEVNFGREVNEGGLVFYMDNMSFVNSSLTNVLFSNQGLNMDFTDATLSEVIFSGDISGTDFRGATLHNVVFSPNEVFFLGGLADVNFEGLDLSRVELPIGNTSCPIFSPAARYRCDILNGIQLTNEE